VVFNLIRVKKFYLNTDILLKILGIKLRQRKNRIMRTVNFAFRKIKLPFQRRSEYLFRFTLKRVSKKNVFFKEKIKNYPAVKQITGLTPFRYSEYPVKLLPNLAQLRFTQYVENENPLTVNVNDFIFFKNTTDSLDSLISDYYPSKYVRSGSKTLREYYYI
jgi:hypothetical protein